MFLGALVPFVGPFVAGASATLIGLANGGPSQAALAIVVAIAVQQIEGNFLQPFIMGRAVKLHPSVVLFAVSAGAILAGIAGIFFAVPVAASLFVVLSYGREKKAL
jgi:predicted PurR-regulated permease PerM